MDSSRKERRAGHEKKAPAMWQSIVSLSPRGRGCFVLQGRERWAALVNEMRGSEIQCHQGGKREAQHQQQKGKEKIIQQERDEQWLPSREKKEVFQPVHPVGVGVGCLTEKKKETQPERDLAFEKGGKIDRGEQEGQKKICDRGKGSSSPSLWKSKKEGGGKAYKRRKKKKKHLQYGQKKGDIPPKKGGRPKDAQLLQEESRKLEKGFRPGTLVDGEQGEKSEKKTAFRNRPGSIFTGCPYGKGEDT